MNDKNYRIKITKILKIFPNNYFKNNDIKEKATLQQMKISLVYQEKNLEEILDFRRNSRKSNGTYFFRIK